ncbi:MAG: hypothetical protein ABR926_25500 [Streptosporangiaceae bacterium]|jgi:hypothetical protein
MAGAASVLPILLEACGNSSSSASGGSGTISLWDGEVGTGQLNTEAKKLVTAWKDGNLTGGYELLTGNIYEVIEAALAGRPMLA